MEGIEKRGEPQKRWTIEAEENLKTTGLKVVCIGQRTEEMEVEECIKSQSSQNTSVLEKRKKEKKMLIMIKKK
jgi:hypothetical protein